MKEPANRRGQAGFTLIEILITVAITGIVLASLIAAFNNQQKVFQQQTDLTRSQSSARAAMSMMARDIRMAGYTGVPLGWQKMMSLAYPAVSLKDGAKKLTAPTMYSGIATQILTVEGNTADAIAIMGNFARQSTSLKNNIVSGQNQMVVNDVTPFASSGFNTPAWVMVGSSSKRLLAETMMINSVVAGGTAGATSGTLTVLGYFANCYTVSGSTVDCPNHNPTVSPLFFRVYYINPRDQDAQGRRQPRLYVRNYSKPSVPGTQTSYSDVLLAQGISDLQITYDVLKVYTPIKDIRTFTGEGIVCDPCTIRNVNLTLTTWSDKFRGNKPLLRKFSTEVRVRNLGIGGDANQVAKGFGGGAASNCPIVGCVP